MPASFVQEVIQVRNYTFDGVGAWLSEQNDLGAIIRLQFLQSTTRRTAADAFDGNALFNVLNNLTSGPSAAPLPNEDVSNINIHKDCVQYGIESQINTGVGNAQLGNYFADWGAVMIKALGAFNFANRLLRLGDITFAEYQDAVIWLSKGEKVFVLNAGVAVMSDQPVKDDLDLLLTDAVITQADYDAFVTDWEAQTTRIWPA